MNRKKMILGIWLMIMTLLSQTAFTMFFVSQMRFKFLLYSYSALAVTQIFALTVFLIGREKVKNRILRVVYQLCIIASLAVIPAFMFIFEGLLSQYHANIKDAVVMHDSDGALLVPGSETTVYKTDTVYVFFPKYSHIDMECGKRPGMSDKSITWCSSAAFQHAVQLGFSDENIEGYHASKGQYFDNPYVKEDYAAVTFYDGGFHFEFDDPESAIKEAADHGGSGFMQYRLIRDGQLVNEFTTPRVRSYRAIAELNGGICVIDSIKMMHFEDFLATLQKLHVKNALYMDVGAGWNYSWYRTASGKVRSLFGLKVPWSHNWVVFRA